MDLVCKDLFFSVNDQSILNGVSLSMESCSFKSILGPNGCGKSTLLKNIYRVLKPNKGIIYYDGRNSKDISLKESAKRMAVVAQFNNLNFDCTVHDIVMLGRIPHKSLLQSENNYDYEIVTDSLRKVGLLNKEGASYLSLSGGEKQRVMLARAIAQEPSLLLLDEPTNHLDIRYQLEILQIVKDLNINVLAVLHDIQLACRYSDYIYLMKEGKVCYEGKPQSVINEDSMRDIYGVNSKIQWSSDNQAMIQYI